MTVCHIITVLIVCSVYVYINHVSVYNNIILIVYQPVLLCIHVLSLQIVGPDDRVIYSGERESSGKYTFAAHIDGVYKYCFGNQMSSMTPKIVMFSMEVGDAPKDRMEGDGEGEI